MKRPKLVPLYHQIYLTLRNDLLAGRYEKEGEASLRPLPSEVEMTRLFKASRITVRRALSDLEEEGLVVRKHGVGTFAAPQPDHVRQGPDLSRLYHDLSALMDDYEPQVLVLDMVATPNFVLAHTPGFGAECLHKKWLSRREGKPVHLNDQFISSRFRTLIDMERARDTPVLLLLQRQGVEAETTNVILSATAADMNSAAALQVVAGAPLITRKRTSMDVSGLAIEYSESLTRPDQYGYKFRFSGDSGRAGSAHAR